MLGGIGKIKMVRYRMPQYLVMSLTLKIFICSNFPYKNLNAISIHTVYHLYTKYMQTSVCIQDNLRNFGPNVHILMFANCMQTVDHTPLYVICLHANANCIYTVYIQ